MAMDLGQKGKLRADINVTPLVDVVLVLLIIFMVVTPLLEREFIIHLPEQEVEQVEEPPANQVVVKLRSDNQVEINGEVVERGQLFEHLRRSLAHVPDRALFFDADDQARYGEAVAVLDTARGAGARIIGTILRPISAGGGSSGAGATAVSPARVEATPAH